MGGMLGIREQSLPRNEVEYWDYFNDMIDNRLSWGPVVQDLLGTDFFHAQPKPPIRALQLLPDALWRQAIRPVAARFELITRATLPQRFRDRFDVPFCAQDQARFDRLRKRIRRTWRVVPHDRRYIPLARAAWQDARANPLAYHYLESDIPDMLAAASG